MSIYAAAGIALKTSALLVDHVFCDNKMEAGADGEHPRGVPTAQHLGADLLSAADEIRRDRRVGSEAGSPSP